MKERSKHVMLQDHNVVEVKQRNKFNRLVVFSFIYCLPIIFFDFFWVVMLSKSIRLGNRHNFWSVDTTVWWLPIVFVLGALVINLAWQWPAGLVARQNNDQTLSRHGLLLDFVGVGGWINGLLNLIVALGIGWLLPTLMPIVDVRSWFAILCAFLGIASFYNGQDDWLYNLNKHERWPTNVNHT
ncbi:hypothetical protein [Loigolactobacillus backii]|uniref:hypothetical protein n=1 Tax=Loigolactobacillus backii TaxID=375175 RepID=UPI001785DD17|nr:hypothetical protein [Loigolactobacillus backii]